MKHASFVIIALCALLFSSCGGGNADSSSADTTVIRTPADLNALNEKISSDPDNLALLYKRAQYFGRVHRMEEAITDMQAIVAKDSSKPEYLLTLSDFYFVSNQTRQSKETLEKVIRIDPKNTDAIMKLAELHLYFRQHDKSIEYINMALRIDKYNAKGYFMKGMNYKELKDTAKAISSMQTAVEQDKQYYQAYIQLGLLHAAMKNRLAVDYYKNAIRIQPKSSEAWYDLAKYYQDVRDFPNALGTYNSLLHIDPNNKFAHYNMGVINLVELKEKDIALDHFSKAIEADPLYTQAYYSLGVCYQDLGNQRLAKKAFEDCLRIDPKYEPAIAAIDRMK